MAGILPGEGRILTRHHRPETGEELLDVDPRPSADGVAELQVIRPYAMGRGREVMGEHKTTPGGVDCDNRPRLLQEHNTGRKGIKRRLEKLVGVPERYFRALSLVDSFCEGVIGEGLLGSADLGCLG